MKIFALATLLAISSIAALGAPAYAEEADGSLTVHGVFGGNSYTR